MRCERAGLKLLVRLLLPVCFFFVAHAAAKNQAAQDMLPLLRSAAQRSLLTGDTQAPFRLDATFTLHDLGRNRQEGRYSWLLTSSGDWAKQLAFADYNDLQIGRGDNVWVNRTVDFQPLQAALVQNAFRIRQYLDESALSVDRYYTLSEHHKKLRCADVSRGRLRHTACIDPDGNLSKIKHGIHVEYEYSDFRPVGSKFLPHRIVASRNGRALLEVNVEKVLAGDGVAQNVPEPPEGSVQRKGCLSPTLPRLKEHPPVDYPSPALDAFRQGQVVLYLHVGIDGKIQKAAVTQSAGESLDAAVLDVARHTRYEPATCGNIPVESETELSNTFSIQVVE
jgi:TonB family protein